MKGYIGLPDRLPAIGSYDARTLFLVAACFVPLAVFFLVIWVLPILYALGMSFFADPYGSPAFVAFENYATELASPGFWSALWNSTVYAVATTGVSLLVGLGGALAVNQQIRGGRFVRTTMIVPYLVPSLVVVFMWKFILDPNVGVLNQYMESLGLVEDSIAFFSTVEWAMPAVVVTSVWKYASFAFFIILAQLQTIDRSLYERARVQGASTVQAFRNITLPHLRGTILIIVLVRGIWLFNTFDFIWISTKGGPLETTTTLPIRIYQHAFFRVEFGMATALAGILFCILASGAIVYFRLFSPEEEVTA